MARLEPGAGMKRREILGLIGGALAAGPLAAAAPPQTRRVGIIMASRENDPVATKWVSELTNNLQQAGSTEGHNALFYVRWAAGNPERMQAIAKELVDLRANVIVAHGTAVTRVLRKETRTIPIVFVSVGDPVGEGFVANLSRPGGNLTGFIFVEATVAGKWLELLTEIAPNINVAAALFNPDTSPHASRYYLPSFEAAARTLKVDSVAMPVHSAADIESGITSLARGRKAGLVAMGDPFLMLQRKSILMLVAREKLPAIYYDADFVRDGGLVSYGPDIGDIFRRAVPYVDRILRGASPAELPVQAPTKYEMVVNLRTAKALGLEVPLRFQQYADEVIE